MPAGRSGGAQAGPGRHRRDHRAAGEARAADRRASSKCSATTPIPAWRSRSRCASTTCRTSFPREVEQLSAKLSDRRDRRGSATGRVDLRDLPLVTIDGETAKDFDDAVYCEPRTARGFRLCRRDRRRQPLRAARRRARPRGARARQLGVFPAARDPDAAGEAVQRLVLAQAERRPPVHGLRHGRSRRDGEIARYKFYPAVMHSHARLTYTEVAADARATRGRGGARTARPAAAPAEPARRSSRVLVKAREQRGAIDFETVETQMIFDDQGKIERIVPRQAQRRAPPDRGVHARGQRVRVGLPAQAASSRRSTASTRARRRRSSRRCASSCKGFGLQLAGGDDAAREGLREAARRSRRTGPTRSCCRP